jgi:putative hydrolase of the HAD superfamily
MNKLSLTYKHIFFDLDHTLWDFEKNSFLTVEELYHHYQLQQHTDISVEQFYALYTKHNQYYWDLFRRNEISRDTLRYIRFRKTLDEIGLQDEQLPYAMSEFYLSHLPYKVHLFKDAKEVLDYLSKKYALHIITNGFDEVQHKKLEVSGIKQYFKNVITSEIAGYQKPHSLIFKYALEVANASLLDSIMIGDSIEADIIGAQKIGLDHILFNPDQQPIAHPVMKQIHSLSELMELL